jgi:L-arabinose isomerase
MENTKPRIGLAVMANEWFWKYKMFGDEFLEEINRDFKSIVSKLTEISEVISTGIVLNEEQAIKAAKDLESKNVDLTIVCPIIWTSDIPLIRFLKEIDRDIPIFLWFYSPYKRLPSFLRISDFIRVTGTVGSLQFSHVLKRDKRNFAVIVGSKDEEPLIKEINEYAKAAKTIKDFKRTRVGLLPWRYLDIANTWCDEFKITTRLGPQVVRISVSELFKISQSIPEEEINSFANYLMKNYEVKVSEKSLYASVRASLALAKIFDIYGLDAAAIQDLDDELHQLFKTRPCLYVPSIFEGTRVVSMEGDIHTAIAMLILKKITNQPVLFSEIYAFDKTENIMLMGHTTMLDINVAKNPNEIKIISDCEYEKFDEVEGAYMYFIGKEGTITMLSLVDEVDNYRMIIGKGYSLPISDARIEGYSHIVVQPSLPVEDFLKEAAKAGAGQHWAVVYGDHVSILEKFAELSRLNKTIIGG